jgi:hypothetical protein
MSATVFFQPKRGKSLRIGAPSAFLDLISRLFNIGHGCPFVIRSQDCTILRAAAVATEFLEFREALETLADAAAAHDEINLWVEY